MAQGMQVQSTALEHKPGSVGVAIQLLGEGSQSITKQSTDACWRNHAPSCLFDHQHAGAAR